jgi:hypothetical protein
MANRKEFAFGIGLIPGTITTSWETEQNRLRSVFDDNNDYDDPWPRLGLPTPPTSDHGGSPDGDAATSSTSSSVMEISAEAKKCQSSRSNNNNKVDEIDLFL